MDKKENSNTTKHISLTSIIILSAVLLVGCGFMTGPHRPHMGPAWIDYWGSGPLGMIFSLLLWALAIFGLVSLVRRLFKPHGEYIDNSSFKALEILKERYAKGEIDKAKYEAMKQDLND